MISERAEPPEVFRRKRCSQKFRNFCRETPVWSFFSIELQTFSALQLYSKETPTQVFTYEISEFLGTPILNNICEWTTASLIWNMAYNFTITLSFSSILHNSKANSEDSFYVSFCEINCIKIKSMSLFLCALVRILCVLFILMSSFASDRKKSSS